MRALVLGGASWNRIVHLDRLPRAGDTTLIAHESYEAPGSTGVGKALALAALGHEVTLHAALGRDGAGERLADALNARGVELAIDWQDTPTPQHLNLMNRSGGRLSVMAIPDDPAPRIDGARLAPLIAAAPVVFVGITPSSLPLLPAAAAAAGEIHVDLHEWDGAAAWHRAFLARADSVQLSHERLADPRPVMRRLAQNADRVTCTRGPRGAVLLEDGAWLDVPAAPAQPVDSNGAGDVFAVALWSARARGMDVPAAARFAATAAARAVACRDLVPERLA